MASKTIDALTAAATLDGTEEIPVWQGSATVKTTAAALALLATGSYTALGTGTTAITIGAEIGYLVWGVGPGGPGGGGARQSNILNSSGGAGGGGGSSTWPPIFLPVVLFGAPAATFNAVVPAAPTGGAAASGDSLAGSHGSNGADTTFGPITIGFHGTYGEGGQLAGTSGRGGGASQAAAGTNPVTTVNGNDGVGMVSATASPGITGGSAVTRLGNGGGNGCAGANGSAGNDAASGNAVLAGAGGGAGGGQASAVSKNGGAAGVCLLSQVTTAPAGSTSSASPGTNGLASPPFPGTAGTGGGGGFGNGAGAGTNGGDGGPGCGGGGGGSAVNGNAAGNGGKGGAGALCFVRVF